MDPNTRQDSSPDTQKPMTPFDSLVTPPFLYTLKLLLPYTPPSMQRFLAFYIKFIELRRTMEQFRGFPSRSLSMDTLEKLKPYMSSSEQEMMEQMTNMMNMMEMIQSMQTMSDTASGDFGTMNPMDMMKHMLTPEQQEMFQMYNTMFDQDMNTPDPGDDRKGDPENE